MKRKLIVFGATGGTGKHVVEQAIEQGYAVTAFVRNPDKLALNHRNLHVVKGDVLNYQHVLKAMMDHEAVLCNLGMPASDKTTLRAEGTANIVRAMEATGIQRLVCQTSLGFGDSKAVLPWHMKYLIVPFILKNAFNDHALQESVIENSTLRWTIVRPGNMANAPKTGRYKHGFQPSETIKLKVSRADVAHFMLDQLNNDRYLHQKVGISY